MTVAKTMIDSPSPAAKAGFFRDPQHLRLLSEHVLPGWTGGERRPLKVWSPACATGAEPYSLAMVLDDYASRVSGFKFSILATDIRVDLLEKARRAIYPEKMMAPVPSDWQRRYFLRSRDPRHKAVRLVPDIRQAVRFVRLDLTGDPYPVADDHDIIFCRRPIPEQVLRRLCLHLRPGGLLFVRPTETVSTMGMPLRQVAPAVFSRI